MNCLIVFIGGGLGALVRYLLYVITPKFTYIPACTLIANFLGCFIATVVFMYFVARSDLNSAYKLFLIMGFCGGLSTLSALSLEILDFVQSGDCLRALVYALTTVIVCTLSVWSGVILVKHYL